MCVSRELLATSLSAGKHGQRADDRLPPETLEPGERNATHWSVSSGEA